MISGDKKGNIGLGCVKLSVALFHSGIPTKYFKQEYLEQNLWP